jgi:hypothetical protein
VPCTGHVARPSISLALAGLAARADWHERAAQHFADSHDQHERLGATAWLARTQLDWGRFLLGTGQPARARSLLALARDGAEEMGAADVLIAADTLLAEVQ